MTINCNKNGRYYLTSIEGDIAPASTKGFKRHSAVTGKVLSWMNLTFKDPDAGGMNKKSVIHYLHNNIDKIELNQRIKHN